MAPPRLRLRLFAQQFDLREGASRLGRARTCAISIDDPAISREHAEIVVRDGRAFLRDLGSRNGVFLGGARVYDEVELRSGDRIGVGNQDLVFTRETPSTPRAATPPVGAAPIAICSACSVSFAATEPCCPRCRGLIAVDETMPHPSRPPEARPGWWLALLGEWLGNALDRGDLDEVAELLAAIDDGVAAAILARQAIEGEALEGALRGAIRAAIAQGDARWIAWSLDTIRAFHHRPTSRLVALLEAVPRSMLGEARVALAALLADADAASTEALCGLAAIAAGLASIGRLRAAPPPTSSHAS